MVVSYYAIDVWHGPQVVRLISCLLRYCVLNTFSPLDFLGNTFDDDVIFLSNHDWKTIPDGRFWWTCMCQLQRIFSFVKSTIGNTVYCAKTMLTSYYVGVMKSTTAWWLLNKYHQYCSCHLYQGEGSLGN